MSSRRRPAGGVKSVQGDQSPSGTTKKRVSSEEEINQQRSSRRVEEEIRSHQKQRYQSHGEKRRFAATSAGQSVDDGTKQNTQTHIRPPAVTMVCKTNATITFSCIHSSSY
ncbi:hypothetical protein AMECASPLE_024504 [Ameca splendens]|uniref:Uncharacterized protein n=1 Tax=Ameca splendens TaxID=208324 RepID=A0ABV0Z2Z7_9TELE